MNSNTKIANKRKLLALALGLSVAGSLAQSAQAVLYCPNGVVRGISGSPQCADPSGGGFGTRYTGTAPTPTNGGGAPISPIVAAASTSVTPWTTVAAIGTVYAEEYLEQNMERLIGQGKTPEEIGRLALDAAHELLAMTRYPESVEAAASMMGAVKVYINTHGNYVYWWLKAAGVPLP